PRTAILNNLEYDHADIFPDLGAIETQFHHLIRTVPRTGRLIVNAEEETLARVIARGCWSELEYFSGAELAPPEGNPTPAWRIAPDGKVTHGSAPQGIVRCRQVSPVPIKFFAMRRVSAGTWRMRSRRSARRQRCTTTSKSSWRRSAPRRVPAISCSR